MPAKRLRKGLVNQGYVLELVSGPTQGEYLHMDPRAPGKSRDSPSVLLSGCRRRGSNGPACRRWPDVV